MKIQEIINMLEHKKEVYEDGITIEEYCGEIDFLIELLVLYAEEQGE